MTTVAVTGATGSVGRALLERLEADRTVDRIVGVDLNEPDMPVAKLDFRPGDVRDPLLAHALAGAGTVVHLAFTWAAFHGEDTMFAVNVHGTRNLLQAAHRAGVNKLVLLSTGVVYGAHPDNVVPLDESSPLRANPDFGYAHQRLLAEELVAEWTRAHPDATVTVLRPAMTLGPGIDDVVSRHLEAPRLPLVGACEPPMQFVHVEDLADALHLAVARDLPGAFNVAADGWLSVPELCALLGKKPLRAPETVAFAAARRLWRRGLLAVPAGALRYVMYPWVLSTERLHAQGWAPAWSNREALHEFVATHHEHLSLGRLRVRRRHLYVGAFATAGAALGLLLAGPLRPAVRRRGRPVSGSRPAPEGRRQA
ncbi:MAG TPA: NAD-dependent epimerase/dehydratase family protein [Egibacteraceae bacterium]|nr:NAD-dependent epimerase/dehydratase family protein [Egibacteraceae bacterium]